MKKPTFFFFFYQEVKLVHLYNTKKCWQAKFPACDSEFKTTPVYCQRCLTAHTVRYSIRYTITGWMKVYLVMFLSNHNIYSAAL